MIINIIIKLILILEQQHHKDKILDVDKEETKYAKKLTKTQYKRKQLQLNEENVRLYFTMSCEMCIATFENFDGAKKHYRSIHKIPGFLRCCGRKFLRSSAVREHLIHHINPEAFRSDLYECTYIFF